MNGLHYPDNLYADHEERKARRTTYQGPLGTHPPTDPVTKPAHYQRAGIETIDYIRATLGDGFEAYCIGNVLKYVSRYREKGGIEDLRKAQVYLGWAIEPPEDYAEDFAGSGCYSFAADALNGWADLVRDGGKNPQRDHVSEGHIPKWDSAWGKTPNCDGLSARDIRSPHPMQSEAIREHDERLTGAEDRL